MLVSCKYLSDNGNSKSFSKGLGQLKYEPFDRKNFVFSTVLEGIDHIASKLTTGLFISKFTQRHF
jgi:hypothetical protein